MLCLDGMYLQGPEPVLLRLDHQAGPLLLKLFVGITAAGEEKLASVELPVPGRETSWPAGGFILSSCRQLQEFQPHLPTGLPEQTEVPGRLWSLCISFPLFVILQIPLRLRYQAPHC